MGSGRAAAAPREQTAAPTRRRRRRRRRDWGVRNPGIVVLVRNALRLVCTLSTRWHHRQLFNPFGRCGRALSLRRTQLLSDPPSIPPSPSARSPPSSTRRRQGSANRPNTTAAAGALKCRPSSFMRRVSSTRPTDGCCGRPEVRVSRKSRVIFARVRGRRRRKKRERFL